MSVKKAILIPGNGCGDDLSDCMWYPWMAAKLEAAGVAITLVGFPDHLYAHEHIWKKFAVEELGLDRHTIVIGHSSGSACALRLMEEHELAACVLVSAYQDHLGDDLEKESGYFSRPFDYEKMKQNCPAIAQFHSGNDPLVPVQEGRTVAKGLAPVVQYTETPLDGHFQAEDYDGIWEAIVAMGVLPEKKKE